MTADQVGMKIVFCEIQLLCHAHKQRVQNKLFATPSLSTPLQNSVLGPRVVLDMPSLVTMPGMVGCGGRSSAKAMGIRIRMRMCECGDIQSVSSPPSALEVVS